MDTKEKVYPIEAENIRSGVVTVSRDLMPDVMPGEYRIFSFNGKEASLHSRLARTDRCEFIAVLSEDDKAAQLTHR